MDIGEINREIHELNQAINDLKEIKSIYNSKVISNNMKTIDLYNKEVCCRVIDE